MCSLHIQCHFMMVDEQFIAYNFFLKTPEVLEASPQVCTCAFPLDPSYSLAGAS